MEHVLVKVPPERHILILFIILCKKVLENFIQFFILFSENVFMGNSRIINSIEKNRNNIMFNWYPWHCFGKKTLLNLFSRYCNSLFFLAIIIWPLYAESAFNFEWFILIQKISISKILWLFIETHMYPIPLLPGKRLTKTFFSVDIRIFFKILCKIILTDILSDLSLFLR